MIITARRSAGGIRKNSNRIGQLGKRQAATWSPCFQEENVDHAGDRSDEPRRIQLRQFCWQVRSFEERFVPVSGLIPLVLLVEDSREGRRD